VVIIKLQVFILLITGIKILTPLLQNIIKNKIFFYACNSLSYITSLLGVAVYTFWWWILKVRLQLPIGVQLQLLLHRAPIPKYWGFMGNRKWRFGDFSARGHLLQFLMMDFESLTPTSYSCSIVTFVLSRTIPEILRFYWKPEMTFWWIFR
jgi:hypothetical protein